MWFLSHRPLLEIDQVVGEKTVLLSTNVLHNLHRKQLVECRETFSSYEVCFSQHAYLPKSKESIEKIEDKNIFH